MFFISKAYILSFKIKLSHNNPLYKHYACRG
uniref:Uncharacterized protein n=1 Tax=Podoviridae sp. ctBev14 TaxID=2823556 RepID=A0A8S5LAR4_9CAUD|nr:MAG TPA: hypothetical protein [Podoviridae sp. ctBev14]